MSHRFWRIVLTISLGINILLAAGLITREVRRRLAPAPAPPAAVFALRTALQSLPPDDASALRQALIAAAPTLRPAQQAVRAAMDAVRAEVERTPLDPAALRAAMARSQAARAALTVATGEVLLGVAPRLSPEGRKRLAALGPARN